MNEWMRKLLFLPEQASIQAQDVDLLHYVIITTTMAGALVVTAVATLLCIRYRAAAGRGRPPPKQPSQGHSSGGLPIALELAVVAGLLTLFVAFWLVGYRQLIAQRTPPRDSMDVYVTGKKWMWSFAYPDGSGSHSILYVPAGRPVRLVMTSRDVIHSFFLPQFRIKQDVLPGRATVVWFQAERPGIYDIFCTEYCGTGHSTMRGKVHALPAAEFERRLEGLPPSGEPEALAGTAQLPSRTLAEIGQDVAAARGCLRCHTVDGTPHIGPTWAAAFGSTVELTDGTSVNFDEAYLTESMMDPMAKVHAGFAPIMPSYMGQISAAEVGALVEFIRSLKGVRPLRHAPLVPTTRPRVVSLPQSVEPTQPSRPPPP